MGVAVFFGSFSSAVRRNEQIVKGAALIYEISPCATLSRNDKGEEGRNDRVGSERKGAGVALMRKAKASLGGEAFEVGEAGGAPLSGVF